MKSGHMMMLAGAMLGMAQPAAAKDWFRVQLAENWAMHPNTFEVGGKKQVVVIGYPGGTEGNAVIAMIPADGEISFFNNLFICDQRVGKSLNVWTADRTGATVSDAGADADYQPIPAGTLANDVMTFACTGSNGPWVKIEGDVLAAADRLLAGD